MLKTAAAKIAWVGRTASMVFGLALVMALSSCGGGSQADQHPRQLDSQRDRGQVRRGRLQAVHAL